MDSRKMYTLKYKQKIYLHFLQLQSITVAIKTIFSEQYKGRQPKRTERQRTL